MSYPDLGCYAECLTCEMCVPPVPPGEVDLFPDDLWGDDPAYDDYQPPPEPETGPDEWWKDYDLPSGPGVGGVDIYPTWNPWGVTVGGKF